MDDSVYWDSAFIYVHDLVTWAFVCFGISFALTHSKVFAKVREKANSVHHMLGYFMECPMCMGFWVGMGLGFLWVSPTGVIALDGFFGLTACWLLFCISWKLALKDDKV